MRDTLDLILTGFIVLFSILGVIVCAIIASVIILPFTILNWIVNIPFKIYDKIRGR
jgi:hypothetical protein